MKLNCPEGASCEQANITPFTWPDFQWDNNPIINIDDDNINYSDINFTWIDSIKHSNKEIEKPLFNY